MSNIYIRDKELTILKKAMLSNEKVIYATYALIAKREGKIYRWESPILITDEYIIFIQPAHSKYKAGINRVPLYKTHVFKNYKHIYVSSFDFRPKYSEKSGENKKDFKNRRKEFQKVILPYVVDSQKEHLKVIEANKNNEEFYDTKDLKEMPWFGTEKKLEKHIRKTLPKFEKKLEKIS